MTKKMNMSGVTNELEQGSAFFRSNHSSPSHKSGGFVSELPRVKGSLLFPTNKEKSNEPKVAQISAQKVEQTFEQLSKHITTEDIEGLKFRLRKVQKTKVNTEVPVEWKEQLDDLAYRLGVGKYELLMYIIGEYLGGIEAGRNGQV